MAHADIVGRGLNVPVIADAPAISPRIRVVRVSPADFVPESIVFVITDNAASRIRQLNDIAVCVIYKNPKKNCGLILYGNADTFSVEGDRVHELFDGDIKVDLHLIASGYPNLAD